MDYTRTVEEYLTDFFRRTGHELEAVDVNSREGQELIELYDLTRLPAILVTSDDGRVLYRHMGIPLPLMRDISLWMERG
jgi:hypothetical protein